MEFCMIYAVCILLCAGVVHSVSFMAEFEWYNSLFLLAYECLSILTRSKKSLVPSSMLESHILGRNMHVLKHLKLQLS